MPAPEPEDSLGPHDQPSFQAGPIVRPRTSRLSILALGLNIPCFLPPFTVAATVLGIIALVRVRRRRDLNGAAMALAAIVIGTGLTAVSIGPWWRFAWITTRGPIAAIRAAERGDLATLRTMLAGDERALTDEELTVFAQELSARYGSLVDGQLRRADGAPRRGEVWTLPFDLRFERETVPAIAGITFGAPTTGESTFMLTVIQIQDAVRGDLLLPPRSRRLTQP